MHTLPRRKVSVATLSQTAPLAGRGMGSSHSAKITSPSCRNNVVCSGCIAHSAAFSSALVPVELNRKRGAVSDHAAALSLPTRYWTFLDAMTHNNSGSSKGMQGFAEWHIAIQTKSVGKNLHMQSTGGMRLRRRCRSCCKWWQDCNKLRGLAAG